MALDILGPIQQGLQIREQKRGRITDELQQKLLAQQIQGLEQRQPIQQQMQQLGLQQQELGIQQQQQGIRQAETQAQEAADQRNIDVRNRELSSIAQGAESALSLSGNSRQSFLERRLTELKKQGRNSEATEEVLELAQQFGIDSPEVTQALNQGIQIANSFGILTPQQQVQKQIEAEREKTGLESQKEIRKEVRGRVGSEVKALSKSASTIAENAGKLTGLVGEIKKGNRSAVAQALVSLVKLGDPGSVVKDTEMEAALNAPNPIAALTGIGVDTTTIESIVRKIDPLNPATINTDEILSTANALISANVPSIQSRFEEQRQLAGTNLTEAGVKSLFPEDIGGRIKGLSDLIKAQPGPKFTATNLNNRIITEQDIQDTLSAPGNEGLTREDLFKQLGVQ